LKAFGVEWDGLVACFLNVNDAAITNDGKEYWSFDRGAESGILGDTFNPDSRGNGTEDGMVLHAFLVSVSGINVLRGEKISIMSKSWVQIVTAALYCNDHRCSN
jgi:hypothetical protein